MNKVIALRSLFVILTLTSLATQVYAQILGEGCGTEFACSDRGECQNNESCDCEANWSGAPDCSRPTDYKVPQLKSHASGVITTQQGEEVALVFGGYDNWNAEDVLWEWKPPPVNTWTVLTPSNAGPKGRQKHVAVGYEDSLVIHGGVGSFQYFGDTWVYNYTTNTWACISPGTLCQATDPASALVPSILPLLIASLAALLFLH